MTCSRLASSGSRHSRGRLSLKCQSKKLQLNVKLSYCSIYIGGTRKQRKEGRFRPKVSITNETRHGFAFMGGQQFFFVVFPNRTATVLPAVSVPDCVGVLDPKWAFCPATSALSGADTARNSKSPFYQGTVSVFRIHSKNRCRRTVRSCLPAPVFFFYSLASQGQQRFHLLPFGHGADGALPGGDKIGGRVGKMKYFVKP